MVPYLEFELSYLEKEKMIMNPLSVGELRAKFSQYSGKNQQKKYIFRLMSTESHDQKAKEYG